MCPRQRLSLAASIQLFERILTDHIQHAEAGCAIAVTAFILVAQLHQALIHQRGQPVENVDAERLHTVGRDADPCRRLECAPTSEDGQPPKEHLLFWGQQVIAPGERVAHRLLPLVEVARPTCQHRQRPLQSLEQCRRGQQLDARRGQQLDARRGQLDSQR